MTVTGSRIATKRRSLNDDVGTSVVVFALSDGDGFNFNIYLTNLAFSIQEEIHILFQFLLLLSVFPPGFEVQNEVPAQVGTRFLGLYQVKAGVRSKEQE